MSQDITSVRAYHDLDLGVRLKVEWPGNRLDGQIITTATGGDGHISPAYIDYVDAAGRGQVLSAEAFETGCRLVMTD